MNPEQLTLIATLCREGSLAAAARQLGASPSSLSRQLNAFETELGVTLFHRTTRQFTPTEAGKRLYKDADRLLTDIYAVRQSVIGDQEPSGTLRISASTAFGQLILVPRLGEFLTHYPKINLDLVLTDERTDLIRERIDIAIRHGDLADSGLIRKSIRQADYMIVASPDLIRGNNLPGRPEDLSNLPTITFSFAKPEWVFVKGGRTTRLPLSPRLSMPSATSILSAVKAGLGIAVLADWTVDEALAEGYLQRLLPNWTVQGPSESAAIALLFPDTPYRSSAARAFIDWASERLQ